MKLILSLFIYAASAVALAGPEDHIAAQVCYDIQKTQYVPTNVPSQICLETLDINPMNNTISIYSYFYPKFYTNVKLTSLIRITEDNYSFKAESVLFNEWNSGCGDGETVTMHISGLTDFNGSGDISALKISVEQDFTNDTCHSEPQTTVFKYVNPYSSEISDVKRLTIEKGQRFAAGWYSDETQNMFTSYPYGPNWDGKMSCGVNLQVPQLTVDALFSKGHDGQFFYLAKKQQNLKQSNFKAQITPFNYEECLEYSSDNNPEDRYCVRSKTVYGQYNSFQFTFENSNMNVTVACSKGEDLDSTKTTFNEVTALEVVQKMLNINIK